MRLAAAAHTTYAAGVCRAVLMWSRLWRSIMRGEVTFFCGGSGYCNSSSHKELQNDDFFSTKVQPSKINTLKKSEFCIFATLRTPAEYGFFSENTRI